MKSKPLRCHGYRLSPNEEARVIQEEKDKLRKLRLVQVRELSKQNAALIRESVRAEKQKQLQQLAKKVEKELDDVHEEKLRHLEARYDNCVRTIGTGHKEAGGKKDTTYARQSAAIENARRAEIRYREAMEVLKMEQQQKDCQTNYPILSRKLALEVERERASHIAALPPPPPDPTLEIGKLKHKPVRMTDSSAFSLTHYHMPQDIAVERANPHEQVDARDSAKDEADRIEHEHSQVVRSVQECQERARVRHNIARKKELLRLDYDNMLHDLSDLQRADMHRRQKQVAHIPKQVFQPPHRRVEEKHDKQQTMEQAFEDMYLKETDFTGDISLALDPYAAMDSPVATDELELSVMSDREPTNQSDYPIPTQLLPPLHKSDILKDVTNIAKDQTDQSPQKSVLKKLFSQIKSQREDWVTRSSSQESPGEITSVSPDASRKELPQTTPATHYIADDPVRDGPVKLPLSSGADVRQRSPQLHEMGSPSKVGLSSPVQDTRGQLSPGATQMESDSHTGKVEEAMRELREIQEKKERLEEKLREYSLVEKTDPAETKQLLGSERGAFTDQHDVQKNTSTELNRHKAELTHSPGIPSTLSGPSTAAPSYVSGPSTLVPSSVLGNLRPQKHTLQREYRSVESLQSVTVSSEPNLPTGWQREASQPKQDLRPSLSEESPAHLVPSASRQGIKLAASDAIERRISRASSHVNPVDEMTPALSGSSLQDELRSEKIPSSETAGVRLRSEMFPSSETVGVRSLESSDHIQRIRDYQQKLLNRHESWKMLSETRTEIERRRNELKHKYPHLNLPQMTSLPSSSTYLPSHSDKPITTSLSQQSGRTVPRHQQSDVGPIVGSLGLSGPVSTLPSFNKISKFGPGHSVSDTLIQTTHPSTMADSNRWVLDSDTRKTVSLGHLSSVTDLPPSGAVTAHVNDTESDNIRKQLLFDSETPATSPTKQTLVSPSDREIVSPVRLHSYPSTLLKDSSSRLSNSVVTTDFPPAIPLGQSRQRRAIRTSPESEQSNSSINRSIDQISVLTSAAQERRQYFEKRQQQLTQQLEEIQRHKAQCLEDHGQSQELLRQQRQQTLQDLIQGLPTEDLRTALIVDLNKSSSESELLKSRTDMSGQTLTVENLRENQLEENLQDISLRSDQSQGKKSWADILNESSQEKLQTSQAAELIIDEPHELSTILEVESPPKSSRDNAQGSLRTGQTDSLLQSRVHLDNGRNSTSQIDRNGLALFPNRHDLSFTATQTSRRELETVPLRQSGEEFERYSHTDLHIDETYEPVLSGLTIRRAADPTLKAAVSADPTLKAAVSAMARAQQLLSDSAFPTVMLSNEDQEMNPAALSLGDSGSDLISAISGSQSKNSTESSLWVADTKRDLSGTNHITDAGREYSNEVWHSADLRRLSSPHESELTQYSTDSKKSGLTQYSGEFAKSGLSQNSSEFAKSGLTQYSGSPESQSSDSSHPLKHLNLYTSRSFERLDPEMGKRVAWKSDRDRVSPSGLSELTQYTSSSVSSRNLSNDSPHGGSSLMNGVQDMHSYNQQSDFELTQHQPGTSLSRSRHGLPEISVFSESSVTDARMLSRSDQSGAIPLKKSDISPSGSELTQYSNSPSVSDSQSGAVDKHVAKSPLASISVDGKQMVKTYPLAEDSTNTDVVTNQNKSAEFLMSGSELRRYNSATERRAITSQENIASDLKTPDSEEFYWCREPNATSVEPSSTYSNPSFTRVSYLSDFSDTNLNNYNALKESTLSSKGKGDDHGLMTTTSNNQSDIFRAVKVFIEDPENQSSPELHGLTRQSIGTDERSSHSESTCYMTLPPVNRQTVASSRADLFTLADNFTGEFSDKGDNSIGSDFNTNRWIEGADESNKDLSMRSDLKTWKEELQLGSLHSEDTGITDEPDLTLVSLASENSLSKYYDSQSDSLVSFEKHEDSVDNGSGQTPRRHGVENDVILYLQQDYPPNQTSKKSSLQEAFLDRKKDFAKDSEKRVEKSRQKSRQPVSDMSKTLAAWKQTRGMKGTVSSKASPKKPHLIHKTKTTPERKKEEKEKTDRTKRLYNQLEEVKEKNVIDERQKQYAANRVKAKQYHQKMQNNLKKQRSVKK